MCFAGLILVGVVIFFFPIGALGRVILGNETYSHIPLIPLMSLFLLGMQRKSIFAVADRRPATGFTVCAGGVALYGIAFALREHLDTPAFRNQDVPNDYLTLCTAGLVAWIIGSFIAIYGTRAFKEARFALLFLVFMIPIPMFLLDRIITALQYASAEAADIVFGLTGASYYRNGMVFEFPNVAIRVAEECSGIRSSLSLFILATITGFFFLRTQSRRVILALAIFPITVVKNGFRIVTVTLLANYVDMRFITHHWIHQSGGIPFFAVALMMFIPIVWMLRRSEARSASKEKRAAGSGQLAADKEPAGKEIAGSGQ
jgi:exosortase